MPKILVIDDQEDILLTISDLLKNLIPDCTVITTLSGKKGIELAKSELADVILLDISMPGIDGFETCRRLKEDKTTKHIPVILVTAIKTDAESRVKGLDLGADAFISKPVEPAELAAQVKVMLRIKKAEDILRQDKKLLQDEIKERISKLQKSEKKFKQLFENIPDAVFVLRMGEKNFGQILDANPTAENQSGYTRDELIGMNILHDLSVEKFDKILLKERENKLDKGESIRFIEQKQRKDGSTYWTEVLTTSMDFEDEKVAVSVNRDITDRKQAEEALRKSETLLTETGRMTKVGGWEVDAITLEVSWTEEIYRIHEVPLGHKPSLEEAINFYHPDDRHKLETAIQKALEHGEPYDMEFRFITAKGIHLWVHTICKPITVNGKTVRLTGTFQDITELKRDEAALSESETRYRSLVENFPGAIMIICDQKIVFVNPAALQYLRANSQDQVIGKPIDRIIHPDRLEKTLKRMMAGEKDLYPIRNQYKRLDGSEFPVEVMAVPILFEGKEAVQIIVQDMTDRLRAEEALNKSEENYRELIENLGEGIAFMDANVNFTLANPATHEIFGKSGKGLIGKNLGIFVDQKSLVRIKSKIGKKKETKKQVFDLEIRRHDKSIRFLVLTASQKHDESGTFTGIFCIFRDVTEQVKAEKLLEEQRDNMENLVIERTKKLEEESNKLEESRRALINLLDDVNETRLDLERSNKQLEDEIQERQLKEEEARHFSEQLKIINAELETFSYSVSHDLRAPLRHMSGFIGLLQKHAFESLDDKSRNYISIVHESSEKMGILIDNLLTFSRTGRAEIKKIKLDVNLMVKQLINELKPEIEKREVKWVIAKVPGVYADKILFQQVLVNLFSNALKFSRSRKQAIIEFGSLSENKNKKVFFIRDNGVGFNPKYKDKLFGVFQRLHSNDEFGGTGIGLANVRRIITRHGGQIWAESKVGKGATFYFSLPKK
jgi:PAS domain S-box-containing protein